MKHEFKVGDYVTDITGQAMCRIINICPGEIWGYWYDIKCHCFAYRDKIKYLFNVPSDVKPATEEEIRIYKEEAEPHVTAEEL